MKRYFSWLSAIALMLCALVGTSVHAEELYTIARGDTLTAIALHFGTSVDILAKKNRIRDPNLIFAGATLRIDMPHAAESNALPLVREETKVSEKSARRAKEVPVHTAAKAEEKPAVNPIVAACDVTGSVAHLGFPSEVELMLLQDVQRMRVALPLAKGGAKQYYEVEESGVRFGLLLTSGCKAIKMVRAGSGPPNVEVVLNDRAKSDTIARAQPEIAPGHVEENGRATADDPLYGAERMAIRRFLREVVDPPYDTRPIEEMMLARYRLP